MVLKKPQFLTIIGNIGSGKSEAAAILSKALGLELVDADSLFQTIDPFAKPYLKDINRWAFTNELWLTVKRAELIAKQAHPEAFMVVDSGLVLSWMYVFSHKKQKHITLKEWRFFCELYDHFAENFMSKTLIVRLKYSVPTLMKRIEKRGRPFELKYYTNEYISGLEKGMVELEKKIRRSKIPMLVITEKNLPEFVESATGRKQLIKKTRSFVKKYVH